MRRKNIVHKIILKMECFFSNLNKDILSLLFNRYLVYNDYVSLLLLNKETYKYLKSTESRIKQKVALRYWRWKDGKMEHTIFNHVFKKWYFDKETTDICGNVVWNKGILHISGYIDIDDSYPEYVKHARDLISTWWEFDFWELRKMQMIWNLILNHNVKSLQVDKIGKYLLRECRHVSIEEIKSRYCL